MVAPNLQFDMPSPFVLYEEQVVQVSLTYVCTDPWFSAQLAASRRGDEEALRLICGSCLLPVLNIAKRLRPPDCPIDILDLVQEGNSILLQTIRTFQGKSADEFLRELTAKVEHRLTVLIQHPDLLA